MVETKKAKGKEEDRLSALPDPILTDILSRLPINSAAATSVLSHRWRHLWTGVTRLHLSTDSSHFTHIVHSFLHHLTSPKLSEFQFELNCLSPPMPQKGIELHSFFRQIYQRGVEYVNVYVQCIRYDDFFWVLPCLFDSQFLSVLELSGKLKIAHPQIGGHYDDDLVQLPNLKTLKFNFLYDHCPCLGTIVKSCPLLEDLELWFHLSSRFSRVEGEGPVDIVCPNLKSLRIGLGSSRETECAQFHIDAPKLTDLKIEDCFSFYCFAQNPITLVRACVDLRRDNWLGEQEKELVGGEYGEVEYLKHMSKFIRGMSSVSTLDLKIESSTNVLAYLYSVDDDGEPQIFSNLTHFETTLNGIGLGGWKDLLLSLQCFPNLKYLKVNMEGDQPLEPNQWCVPDCVPDCLVNTLDKIHISGLNGCEDDLKLLLEYILSNANLLEELRLQLLQPYIIEEHEKADATRKESQLCKSLFELPRRSSTCQILFSGAYVTASSNEFKRECLTC